MDTMDRETQEIILSIKKGVMLISPALSLATIGTVKLLQYLARLAQEKIIEKMEVTNFQEFIKKTDGDFKLVNIPVDLHGDLESAWLGTDSLDKDLEVLRKNGVNFFVMPDLNGADGYEQIAVARADEEVFSAWFETYIITHMKGGEKDFDTLQAFTDSKTTLYSIPFEGEEEIFREDFANLRINYSVLPDLRVGDGQIQIVIANKDTDKLKHWYSLYRKNMLKEGVTLPDLTPISMETYKKTAEMTEEEYVQTADEEAKAANEKYEKGKEETQIQKIHLAEGEKTYEDFEGDLRYQKFTIDEETLVTRPKEKDPFIAQKFKELDEKGFFASKVPKTGGRTTQYMIVQKENVFEIESGDGKKTFTVFYEKEQQPHTFNQNWKPLGPDRLNAEQMFDIYYDLSKREEDITQSVRNNKKKQMTQKVKKDEKVVKAPKPPVKVR